MAFNNDKAAQKWAQIQKAESVPLSRIAAGNGTPQDYKRVGAALDQYSKLAATVFSEVVRSNDALARKRIDAINAHREKKGKEPLTADQTAKLMQQAVADGWESNYDRLVTDIAELVNASSTEQTETLGGYLDDHFAQFKEERKREGEDANEGTKQDFYEALDGERDLEAETWAERASSLVGAIKSGIVDAMRELIAGPQPAPALEGPGTSLEDVAMQTKGDPSAGPVVAMSSSAEDTLNTAVVNQNSFNTSVEDKLDSILRPDPGEQSQKDDEAADSWWRRFKLYMGDKFEKANSGILGEILKLGAALLITNPEIREWISQKIDTLKEIFTWDNVEKVVKGMIKYLSDQASSLANWIMKKLGMDDESKLEDRIENRNKAIEYWNSQAEMFDKMAEQTSNANTKKRYEQKAQEARDNAAAAAKEQADKQEELDKLKKEKGSSTETVSAPSGGGEGGSGGAGGGGAPAVPQDTTSVTTAPTEAAPGSVDSTVPVDPNAPSGDTTINIGGAAGMPTKADRRAARERAAAAEAKTTSTIDTPSIGAPITSAAPVNTTGSGASGSDPKSNAGSTLFDIDSFGFAPASGDELLLANLLS